MSQARDMGQRWGMSATVSTLFAAGRRHATVGTEQLSCGLMEWSPEGRRDCPCLLVPSPGLADQTRGPCCKDRKATSYWAVATVEPAPLPTLG